jgi:monofunctional biosynthetic peptidoglycan transglycosylase
VLRVIWKVIKVSAIVVVAAFALWIIYEVVTFPRVWRLRDTNPETTNMIETRNKEARAEGREPRVVQQWVPLSQISVEMQRAVLAGEDVNFASHNGFDYEAIRKAWEEGQREANKEAQAEGDHEESGWIPDFSKFKRGGSTISQQLAKNLYLSSEKSFARKAREAVYTYFIERSLSKCRILEIYLNVIEWGDGVYGVEAASQLYHRKHASELNADEAAYLAAMIPNPRSVFNHLPTPQNPNPNHRRIRRRRNVIKRGMPNVTLPKCSG